MVKKILAAIRRRLRQESLEAQVVGREKHLYSLYRKMREQKLPFGDVMDVYAFRIVVDSVDTCYRVLGVVHNMYKPVLGKFKDYIAMPKANGYQSLHTVLFGPYGVPIEVQIRNENMHAVAESGIAAHWDYRDRAGNAAEKHAHQWMRELLELHKEAGDSVEFIENLKIDLFPDEIFVFTPAGRHSGVAARRDCGRSRLCDSYRCRQHMCRGQSRPKLRPASNPAADGTNGRGGDRAVGPPKSQLVELCRHRQGSGKHQIAAKKSSQRRGG